MRQKDLEGLGNGRIWKDLRGDGTFERLLDVLRKRGPRGQGPKRRTSLVLGLDELGDLGEELIGRGPNDGRYITPLLKDDVLVVS